MKTNTKITIFNRYIINGSETYHKTTINRAVWENTRAANIIKSGMMTADSVTVFLPFSEGTNYLKPTAWNKLDAKVGKWTLQPGDILVKGEIADTIGSAFTITDLNGKYDDIVRITTVDTMDNGSESMKHWRVGAK